MSELALRIMKKVWALEAENKALKESHAELLSALKVAADEEDGYVFNDTIQRAEALKEKANE